MKPKIDLRKIWHEIWENLLSFIVTWGPILIQFETVHIHHATLTQVDMDIWEGEEKQFGFQSWSQCEKYGIYIRLTCQHESYTPDMIFYASMKKLHEIRISA